MKLSLIWIKYYLRCLVARVFPKPQKVTVPKRINFRICGEQLELFPNCRKHEILFCGDIPYFQECVFCKDELVKFVNKLRNC
jgi:hypothetical protein